MDRDIARKTLIYKDEIYKTEVVHEEDGQVREEQIL
jgi:hypothetical protein